MNVLEEIDIQLNNYKEVCLIADPWNIQSVPVYLAVYLFFTTASSLFAAKKLDLKLRN
jgi:hypothetical protein